MGKKLRKLQFPEDSGGRTDNGAGMPISKKKYLTTGAYIDKLLSII